MDKNRLAISSTASFRGCPLGWTKIGLLPQVRLAIARTDQEWVHEKLITIRLEISK
jgi:hypothetical protein